MVLYVAFQTAGGALAGLLLRVSFGSHNFLLGGCLADTTLIPIGDIFAVELMADFVLLFSSFGVGLDPGKGHAWSCARPILSWSNAWCSCV